MLYMLPSFKYCTVRCCSRKLKYANDGKSVGFLLAVAPRELAIKLVINNSFLYVLELFVSYLLFFSALSSCYTVYFIMIKSITFICWGSYAYHSLCVDLRDIQAELLLSPFPIWVPEIESRLQGLAASTLLTEAPYLAFLMFPNSFNFNRGD